MTAIDPVARAARHDIIRDQPSPGFFEGALLGNGAMGVVVCTRPDAVVMHFGHNEVWDIRLAEENADKLGTFREVMQRLRDTWDAGRSIREADSWFRDYCKMARENYAKLYPRPLPCGTIVLGIDTRKVELLGHHLHLADGVCDVTFLEDGQTRTLETFVEPMTDRLWLTMRDGAASPFVRVNVIAGNGDFAPPGWLGRPGEPPEYKLPEPRFDGDGRAFTRRLPVQEDGTPDARDRAMRLAATLDADLLGRIDLRHGAADATPTDTAADLEAARRDASVMWQAYWSRSAVELPDADLEAAWYRNLYFNRCAARPGVTFPGIFGNWCKDTIGAAWHGDYHLDYNTEQAVWGNFSSNHVEQHEPYVDMVHHLLDVGRTWARDYYQMRGVAFPISCYPITMNLNPYPIPTWGWIMSVTPWAVQSLWWHYLYTRDVDYLRDRAWEPMREVVTFFIDYLTRDGQTYHIVPTVSPELHGLTDRFERNRDCIVDLTLLRFLFRAYLEACDILDRHDDIAEQARDIADNLAAYPQADTPDGPVFVSVPGESPDQVYNTPNACMPVFPGEHFGLHSPPEELALARRTWRNMLTEGGTEVVFTAMQGARLGILDLDRFARAIRYNTTPNGAITDRAILGAGRYKDTTDFDFLAGMGVWVENFALPAVINECLMQSYTSEIRLFPNWPADRPARFQTLRGAGAFLVSAEMTEGRVQWIEITSEAGATLRLHNPWPAAQTVDGTRFDTPLIELTTTPGQTLRFTPA